MDKNNKNPCVSTPFPAASLEAVLANREDRVKRQAALLGRWQIPLISFCVNMPGPVKACAESLIIFRAGIKALEVCLAEKGWNSPGRREQYAITGPEALIGVEADAVELKKALLAVEESHELGRLFDFDVLKTNGKAISRANFELPLRRCLICSGPAAECARGRKHDLAELLGKIREMTVRSQGNT